MFSVLSVADEILKIAKKEGRSLTPMQLVKLVYIAHGWSLAIRGHGLFSDPIEAWKYGPVIPSLYHATKQFGRGAIPFDLIDEDSPSELSDDLRSFLQDVFDKYGDLDGIQLSSLTHRYGTPWHDVYRPYISHIRIPDDLIKQHYSEKLREHKQRICSTAA